MLENYIGKPVGFVRINEPIVFTYSGYECAAWWEQRTSTTGVFPLILRKKDKYSNDFIVEAMIPAVVTDDFFPALWGGVSVSNKPYVSKSIGMKCSDISATIDLIEAIKHTGNIPGESTRDWYINPEIWELVIKNREQEIVKAYTELPKWWAQYQAGEDKFHSRVGMVGHFGEMLVRYSKEIQELYRLSGYLNEKSDMWRNLHKKNTAWINTGYALRPSADG